jgi:uncharacterized Zn finger protein
MQVEYSSTEQRVEAETQERIQKAWSLYLDGHTEQVSATDWIVKSQEKSKHYVVAYNPDSLEGSCDCPDYKYRRSDDGDYCKHIYAVVLAAS